MIATTCSSTDLHYCNAQGFSGFANLDDMTGLESDAAFVKDLCRWAKLPPSALAKRAGLTPTTILRHYNATATTRLSQPTFDKLRAKFPEYPGWRRETPDQIGRLGERPDPTERPDELVYIRQVDIALAMGPGAVAEDYPEANLVPFNLGFIRSVTPAPAEKLLIFTGQGESMEPTLLRSDMLMIDTSQRNAAMSDQIWALTYAGGGMVKRVRRIIDTGRERLLLISDNPSVPDQIADVEDVHIIGKLVWTARRM